MSRPDIALVNAVSQAPVLDVECGLSMLGSDELLRQILTTVLDSLPNNVPEIWRALESGDVVAANHVLHSIKGYVPLFCVEAFVTEVTQLERLSKNANAATVTPLFAVLAPRIEQLLGEIRAYLTPL